MKQFDLLEVILISVILVSLTFLGTYFYFDSDSKVTSLSNEVNSINNINICNNKTLSQTSECLRDYVSTFYNYTFRKDLETNISIIKEFGGDCTDYSYLYKTYLTDLGFLTKEIEIYPNDDKKEIGHTFLITWDKNLTEYCEIDLLKVNCERFKKQ